MPVSAPSLHRQLTRVRRRLFLQSLVQRLVGCWVVALLAAVVWFLAEPYVVGDTLPNLRWCVLGGALAAMTLLAVALAAWRQPSPVGAALALDERFQLKERVTTSLTLPPRDAEGPAAVALYADVERRVAPLYVSDRFPIKVPWTAALVPAVGIVLALLAFFYKPVLNQAQANNLDDAKNLEKLVDSSAAKDRLEKMVKRGEIRKAADKPKSPVMGNIDKEIDKLAHKPFETNDDVRDAQKDITRIEDELKKREKDLNDRNEAIKEQMKQMAKKEEKKENNPADRLDNALNNGNFEKAKEEAERLARKLQDQEQARQEEEKEKEEIERLKKKKDDPNLPQEERDQAAKDLQKEMEKQMQEQKQKQEEKQNLEEQLQKDQEKLQRLTRSTEEKKQELEQKKQNGEINQEELDRELEQLAKEEEKEKNQTQEEKDEQQQEKKDLQELAEKLGECQKALKDGNDKEAGEKLAEAAKAMAKLDKKGEQKELQQKLKELQEVKKDLAKAGDKGNGKGDKGNGKGDKGANDGRADPGPNNGGQGTGRRDVAADDGKTNHEEVQSRSNQDNGQINITDKVPGEGFKGPRSPLELKDDIRRASQEAPEAIDRQRLPRSASDMARGYFDKMRGPDKGTDQKPEKAPEPK